MQVTFRPFKEGQQHMDVTSNASMAAACLPPMFEPSPTSDNDTGGQLHVERRAAERNTSGRPSPFPSGGPPNQTARPSWMASVGTGSKQQQRTPSPIRRLAQIHPPSSTGSRKKSDDGQSDPHVHESSSKLDPQIESLMVAAAPNRDATQLRVTAAISVQIPTVHAGKQNTASMRNTTATSLRV
ncbi:hypothetical protein ACLOJK_040391 [Asimina triloba]